MSDASLNLPPGPAAEPGASVRLGDFLPYQLSVTSNAVSARIAEQYRARFGLTVAEWRMVAVLGDGGALTQRELALHTLMDKVAVNRACRSLAERGLVSRAPNEADRRSHRLALTGEGRAVHARIMPLAQAIEAELFRALTAEERAGLRSLLGRIRAAAGRLDPDALTS